jgi:ACS family glucarate transporter-like MFS transporter
MTKFTQPEALAVAATATAPAADTTPTTQSPGRFRYTILALIFFATVINYADRATLSIAGTAVSADLGMSPSQLGIVFSAFAWAYVIGQVPGGWLLDRYGAKHVYGASIVLWSIFTLLQGFVHFSASVAMAVGTLFLLRFMLGLVESPAFPGNARVVSTWFPTAERGLATALFNSAQYLAVVLFAPLMAWMVHAFGWQHVFIFMGALGLALAVVWYLVMGDPKTHPRMSHTELAHIEAGGALTGLDTIDKNKPKVKWAEAKQLFTSRMMWGIFIGQYCITSLTYFFITWFPIYLIQGRGMTIMNVGFVAVLPAICGFTGGILGGAMSDLFIRRGMSPSTARKIPFMLGMGLSCCVVGANYTDSNIVVIAVMALAFFGKGLGAVGWAVVSDTAPREMTGLCGGVFNGLGNIAGIVTPIVIGYVVATTGSFNNALWFVGAHGLIAIAAYGLLSGPFKRLIIVKGA